MPASEDPNRIDRFISEWEELTRFPGSLSRYRESLHNSISRLVASIEEDWYSEETVEDRVEALFDELENTEDALLKESIFEDIQEILEICTEFMEDSTGDDNPEVEDIIRSNLDSDGLDDDLQESDWNTQRIKSSLYDQVATISRREMKRNLEINDNLHRLKEFENKLSSDEFSSTYRNELVDRIASYFDGERTLEETQNILAELLGELQSRNWTEDCFEDTVEILHSERDVEKFLQVIMETAFETEYCVPLPADRLPIERMNVAGVDFYMESADDFSIFEELLEEDESHQEAIETHVDRLKQDTSLFAVLTVLAPTQHIGELRMEEKLEKAIDCMNFGKSQGILQNPFTQRQTKYLAKRSDGRWNFKIDNHRKYLFPFEMNIEEEQIEYREEGFTFMTSDDPSELENRFNRSLQWYGDGIQSGVLEDELLKYIIAMENMMVPESSGGKKTAMADRLADLLKIFEEYREGFKTGVKSLYDTRNTLVHSAETDVPSLDEQVSSAHDKTTRMLAIILEDYIDDYDHTNEILEELAEREVPTEPDDHNPFRVG